MKLKLKHKIAIFLIDLLAKTWRIKITGNFPVSPAIVVFWHGQMLPGWYAFKRKNAKAIVSQSEDGEILNQLLHKWGFQVYRGSSSKGGKEVLETMVVNAKTGFTLITPDGPRGPIEKMKAGAIIASQRSETPLFLCGINIKRKKIFEKSWDNFNLPFPFSQISIKYEKAVHISKDLGRKKIDELIKKIEQDLIEING